MRPWGLGSQRTSEKKRKESLFLWRFCDLHVQKKSKQKLQIFQVRNSTPSARVRPSLCGDGRQSDAATRGWSAERPPGQQSTSQLINKYLWTAAPGPLCGEDTGLSLANLKSSVTVRGQDTRVTEEGQKFLGLGAGGSGNTTLRGSAAGWGGGRRVSPAQIHPLGAAAAQCEAPIPAGKTLALRALEGPSPQ